MIFSFKNKTKNVMQDVKLSISKKHITEPFCVGVNEESESETFNGQIFQSKTDNISFGIFLPKKSIDHSLGYSFVCASLAIQEVASNKKSVGFRWPCLITMDNKEIANVKAIKTNLGIIICIRVFVNSFPNKESFDYQNFLDCMDNGPKGFKEKVNKHPMLLVQKIAKQIEQFFYVSKYSKEYFYNINSYKRHQQVHPSKIELSLIDNQIQCYFRDIDDDCNALFYINNSNSKIGSIKIPDILQSVGYQEVLKIKFM